MTKKIKAFIKLCLPAGKAMPGPPVGPSLGQHGINISAFCKEYNAKTAESIGMKIPVKITVYEDKSYSFILKSPPTSDLLLQYSNLKQGSGDTGKNKLAKISLDILEAIAKIKLSDLNTKSLKKAVSIIYGTAKNMGIVLENTL